ELIAESRAQRKTILPNAGILLVGIDYEASKGELSAFTARCIATLIANIEDTTTAGVH
ncbi:MAG: hypothetical protein H0U64_02210, partial [Gemmatimonadaceae bacterium]|nr:hypothetical protein [Gemmatimonadaceae bacterium]